MALSRKRSTGSTKPSRSTNNSGTLQAAKAANTRAQLIEATIRCLVKYGYANTTTPRVAQEAGLSRGAMMHHFENGAALIKATIIELHEKRLRAFKRTAEAPEHSVEDLVNAYWRQVQKPAFTAFHELAVAARTDSELTRLMNPLQKEFRERFNAQAELLFPEWREATAEFDLAMSLSMTILEGMAVSLQTGGMESSRVEPLLRHLVEKITALKPVTSQ